MKVTGLTGNLVLTPALGLVSSFSWGAAGWRRRRCRGGEEGGKGRAERRCRRSGVAAEVRAGQRGSTAEAGGALWRGRGAR